MKHLMNRKFVMVDIETVSTKQNAAIVAIGAVEFTIPDGITRQFSVNIDVNSSHAYGLDIDRSTLEWWFKQPIETQKAWQTNKKSLPDALNMFIEWLGDCEKTMMVSEGNVFDFGILYSSFDAVGLEKPWKYWNEMDTRTVGIMMNMRMSTGNDHIALKDAINQTEQFLGLFKDE